MATILILFNFNLNNQMPKLTLIQVIGLAVLVAIVTTYSDPTSCISQTQFYDILLLECSACPSNTVRAKDWTFCNCSTSYYKNPDVIGFNLTSSCTSLGGLSYNSTTQATSVYNLDGSVNNPAIITTCVNSYPDSLNTKCIPCGSGMTYSTDLLACQCTAPDYAFNGYCYASTTSWTISNHSDYLGQQHAQVGCKQYGLIQSCNYLMNRCVMAGYSPSDFFCKFLTNLQLTKNPSNGLPVYTFSSQITSSIQIYGSSSPETNTTTVKNTLNFILIEYNADGSINDIKPLDNSIFSCYLSSQDIVDLQSVGSVVIKNCSNNVKKFTTQYFYDVYVKNADGTYSQVPVKVGSTFYKRFTPTDYLQVTIYLTSKPPLQVPYLVLSNSNGNQGSAMAYSISSQPTINYTPFFAIFLVGTIIIFIFNFYRYMKYNPDENNDPYYCFKAIFLMFVYIIKYIAMGIHLWLLCFTTYLFCFYKFQQTIYLIITDYGNDKSGLYQNFQALFYTTFSLTILALFIFGFTFTNSTDYFLIDWQKEKQLGKFEMGKNKKQVSVWRKVLLVNELYELSMVSLFSLLFLTGLKWINHNQLVPSTSYNLSNDNGYYICPLLSYFLISFVIFAVAVAQYLIRHAIKIWWPLPIQNFIDLCSVSNISIIIFDEALHGYYIHGMNPLGQSEGSLSYIESMFQKQAKSFGKSRSFQLDDADHCQTFEVVFPFQIRQAFQVKYKSRFNQKLAGKAYNTSIVSNPIPEMLNEQDYKDLQQITNSMLQSFKYYLQGVKTSNMNVRQRNLLQKIVNCPIDTTTMGKLPVFFKDQWYEFSNVLLSGHQFLFLFNFINFVNIFYIATSSIYFSFFIAIIFQKLLSFTYEFLIKRNISKNTLIDDKFFN